MDGNDSRRISTVEKEPLQPGTDGQPDFSPDAYKVRTEESNGSAEGTIEDIKERAAKVTHAAKDLGVRAMHTIGEGIRDPHRRQRIIKGVGASAATIGGGVGIIVGRRKRAHAREKIEPKNFFEKARARVLERST